MMLVAAHLPLGNTLYRLGAVATAHTHFAQGIALYDSQPHRASAFMYGEDLGVYCRSLSAWTLWYLGYPDRALARSQEAVTLAQQRAHPLSLSHALRVAAEFHQFCRDVCAAQESAAAYIHLAMEQGFPLETACGAVLRGWAQAQQAGQAQAGIEQIQQGLSAIRATGAVAMQSYYLALLAEAHSIIGQPDAGLPVLAEALTLADTKGERWYAPELYRLKGALLLQQKAANQAEAETCFQHSISIAQSQQAKSFELRTATSLARLWQQQGKRQEASDLLAPVYNWFTEGFDTADLQEAKALLEELEL
jgi:predicted ATPase